MTTTDDIMRQLVESQTRCAIYKGPENGGTVFAVLVAFDDEEEIWRSSPGGELMRWKRGEFKWREEKTRKEPRSDETWKTTNN